MTGFELHLQHEEIHFTRNQDKVIMVMMMEVCNDLDQLTLMTREIVFLNATFVSYITTADGKRIEEHALSENTVCVSFSPVRFQVSENECI